MKKWCCNVGSSSLTASGMPRVEMGDYWGDTSYTGKIAGVDYTRYDRVSGGGYGEVRHVSSNNPTKPEKQEKKCLASGYIKKVVFAKNGYTIVVFDDRSTFNTLTGKLNRHLKKDKSFENKVILHCTDEDTASLMQEDIIMLACIKKHISSRDWAILCKYVNIKESVGKFSARELLKDVSDNFLGVGFYKYWSKQINYIYNNLSEVNRKKIVV